MGNIGLVLDPVFETHDAGPGHPERPDRLRSIARSLERGGLVARCRPVAPVEATPEMLARVHDGRYVDRVRRTCEAGERFLDSMDTGISPESYRAALLAAGSLAALCDEVAAGRLRRGFAVLRPPGHHAERAQAMGFCLFNNVAVAARHLQSTHGVQRVMIVDWDVHHGNGTQHTFEEDADVFYFSIHQFPLYPGTGRRDERGRGAGEGSTLNCPIPPGSGDAEFLGALRGDLAAAAERFRPEFVLVSAGFDAHAADPLAQIEVTTEAFAEATRLVMELADRYASGRLVSTLEGGYDLNALAASVTAHVENLLAG